MSGRNDVARVREWLSWACDKVHEHFDQGSVYMRSDCRALAEEELKIGQAMLELIVGFQEMVLDDHDGRSDQERTGKKDT